MASVSSTNRKTIEKNVQLARDLENQLSLLWSPPTDMVIPCVNELEIKISSRSTVDEAWTRTQPQLYSFLRSAPWSTNISISRRQIIARVNLWDLPTAHNDGAVLERPDATLCQTVRKPQSNAH